MISKEFSIKQAFQKSQYFSKHWLAKYCRPLLLYILLFISYNPVQGQQPASSPAKKIGDFIESSSYNDDKRGAIRTLQYRPDGESFVCVNGKNRYTRALYGSHTAFRVETSDYPIFATFEKNNNKNIRFVYICVNDTLPLEIADFCESRYTPGKRSYKVRDPKFKTGEISISVLASPDKDEAIWKIESSDMPSNAIFWRH